MLYNKLTYSNMQTKFEGNSNRKLTKMKRILYEDKYDEFVSSIIKKEKDANNGIISRYKDFLTKKESKRFHSDLKGAIGSLVINNNLHIIKHGNETGTFIDIIKRFIK